MAAFKQHITFSSALGAGYGAAVGWAGLGWDHALLAGGLCGVAGMLPDLDSDSGTPVRELFGFLAALIPALLWRRLLHHGLTPEGVVIVAGAFYLLVRFGLPRLFRRWTVHRGMWHSIPAALIAAEAAFLAHGSAEPGDGLEWLGGAALAGGVFLGYLSHLVLDECYSIDLRGLRPHLARSAGSALKLASRSWPATAATWTVCLGLGGLILRDPGWRTPEAPAAPIRVAGLPASGVQPVLPTPPHASPVLAGPPPTGTPATGRAAAAPSSVDWRRQP